MLKMLKIFLILFVLPCISLAAVNTKSDITVSKAKEKFHGDEDVPPSILETYHKEIKAVEKYLNSFSTFSGVFKQSNKEGMISYGKLYISKPGKIRCEYLNPTKLLLIINGEKVTFYDKEIDEISYASTEANALKILASEDIDFSNLNLVELEKEKHFINLSVKEFNKELKQNLIVTFKFFYPDITLKQITVHTENNEVDLIFDQIDYDRVISNKLFFFNKANKDSF